MIMYSFNKGREVLLLTEDGATQRYALRRNVAPTSDHIVCSPTHILNASLPRPQAVYMTINVAIPFEREALNLAQQGYTVFEMPGRNSNARYGFAVKITENDSEMD
jgi:hypothetical protein